MINLDEEAFFEASTAEQAHQEALIAERQRHEAWQRKRYTRRAVLVGLVGLGLAAGAATTSRLLFPGNTPSSVPPSLPLHSIYRGHTDAVDSVAWSPDGKRLASASADKTVQVWDAGSGQHLLTYQGHFAAVYGVAWSPDGKRLASASFDQTVRVWDAGSGQHLLTYQGHTDAVYGVAWSPDGKQLASAGQGKTVQVWLWLQG